MGSFPGNNYFLNVHYIAEWLLWANLKIYDFFHFSLAYPQTCASEQSWLPVVNRGIGDGSGLSFHLLILSEDSEV